MWPVRALRGISRNSDVNDWPPLSRLGRLEGLGVEIALQVDLRSKYQRADTLIGSLKQLCKRCHKVDRAYGEVGFLPAWGRRREERS